MATLSDFLAHRIFLSHHVKRTITFAGLIGVPLLTAACSNAPQQQVSTPPRYNYAYGETTGSIQRPVVSRPATVYVQSPPQRVVYTQPQPQRVAYTPWQTQAELRRLRRVAATCETTASIPRVTRTAAYSPAYPPAYTTPAYTQPAYAPPAYSQRYGNDVTASIGPATQYQTTAPAQPNAMWHVVAPGETLSMIARRYNVSVIEIARINELRNFPQIRSGSMILIPIT